jgi:hypothetical protein
MRKMKEDIVAQTQEAIDRTKETSKWRSVYFEDKLPEGVGFWRPSFGPHIVDLIPFMAGENHPRVEKGRFCFSVDYYVHRNIGPLGDNWVCTMRTFTIVDAICEYIKRNRPPKEEWKRIKPTRMTGYLVWVHDTPDEEKKGIQIWDVAHFLFQEPVDAQAKHPRGGAPIPYADIDGGKSIYFEIAKSGKWIDSTGKERDASKYQGHKFIDRETPIPDEILDLSFSLDDYMELKPKEELVNASFYGETKTEDKDHENDPGPPPATPDDFKREPVTPPQASEKKTVERELPKKPDFRQYEPSSADWKGHWRAYPEDQPAMLAHQEALKRVAPPAAAPAQTAGAGQCPAGGTFGADNEKLPECRKCACWDDCAAFLDSGQPAAAAPPTAPPATPPTGLRRRR